MVEISNWKLGEKQETLDPALALQGAVGKFKVTSPGGEINVFDCAKGYSIRSIRFLESGEPRTNTYFLVEKISEPVGMVETDTPTLRHKSRAA